VRAEAAQCPGQLTGVGRAWPLLRDAFAVMASWLVRCSILSAWLSNRRNWIRRLCWSSRDGDRGCWTAPCGWAGAEILSRLVREKLSRGRPRRIARLAEKRPRALLRVCEQETETTGGAAGLERTAILKSC